MKEKLEKEGRKMQRLMLSTLKSLLDLQSLYQNKGKTLNKFML